VVTKDALRALAQQAAPRERALEPFAPCSKNMLDVMYDVPSREDIADVVINRAVVEGKRAPAYP